MQAQEEESSATLECTGSQRLTHLFATATGLYAGPLLLNFFLSLGQYGFIYLFVLRRADLFHRGD
jgi:hypothetical protein